jgi:adenylate cyclase
MAVPRSPDGGPASGGAGESLAPGRVLARYRLIEKVGEGGMDFGLARSPSLPEAEDVSQQPTKTQERYELVGTLGYMSPEQVQGLAAGPRSDVFSLGVMLYEMATGRRPFVGRSPAELISSILRDAPLPPTRLNGAYPPRFDRLVARCLEKDPKHRLASSQDLLWELEQLKGELGGQARLARSIAVLPFRDQSREGDQDYLGEGIAEDLIIALSKVEGLRVVSRSASFRFRESQADVREIGERLGAATLLQGSIRRSGRRLRVTAELVDARDSFEIWAERYDREVQDVFAIQDEIAESIARALRVSLSAAGRQALPRPPTLDVQAYDCYLRARKHFYLYSRRGMQSALALFAQAIGLDPGYARAHAGIADCAAFLYQNAGREPAQLAEAVRASRRALELEPELAEAHASHGVALSMSGLHAEAEQEFEFAARLDPGLFEAHYFRARDAFTQGKLEEAARCYEAAMPVRPEDYQAPLLVAQIYDDLGRRGEAEAARRRGVWLAEEHLLFTPHDARALYMGANGLVALGERERGLAWADRALALDPGEPMPLYNIACIQSLAGSQAEALDSLERAVAAGLKLRGWLEHDSNLDPIRGQPRFQALLERLEADESGSPRPGPRTSL